MSGKYSSEIKSYDNPYSRNCRTSSTVSYSDKNNRLQKLLRKTLKNDKISIKIQCIDRWGKFGISKVDHNVTIKYDDRIVFDYPKDFYGLETEVYKLRQYRLYDPKKCDYGLFIGDYIIEYINTPKSSLLNLPSGPYGIYEILMAADNRISLDKLRAISLTFRSSDALLVLGLREKSKKQKKVA